MSYQPGTVVGDYVVLGAVGTGGMGTVYKVQHVITQRIEAMKLLASGRTEPDQEQRFLREMQVQARLHHPNIAAVYNAFRYYDEFFLVLEFIDGESLESVLARGRLPLETGLHYARQALFALGYAHAHGVVHRDIAPSNMLVTPDGIVKLTDFGLAKAATDIHLTHSGAPLGSPWYMSPEHVRGDATLDARSDLYSLGVVLYEIVTGSKPFDLGSTFDVMRAQVELAPTPPIERTPEIPRLLNEIILTAMAKSPNARFQSAEQFYATLESLQTGTSPLARPLASQQAMPEYPPAGATAAKRSPAAASARFAAAAASVRTPGTEPVRKKQPSPWAKWMPQFANRRVMQTAVGTAACALVLFGSYAMYSLLRVTSAAETPAIPAAKPNIPPPPAFSMSPAPAAPSIEPAASVAPAPEQSTPPSAPRPMRRTRKTAARIAAPLVFSGQPAQDPPAPTEREHALSRPSSPAFDDPKPHAAAALPTSAAPPMSSKTVAAPDPSPSAGNSETAADPPVITGPSDDGAAKGQKQGRFWKALHKVVPFHKQSSDKPASESTSSPAPENQ